MRSESAKVALARALISKTFADEPKIGSAATTPHDASQNGNNPSRSSQTRPISRIDVIGGCCTETILMPHHPFNARAQQGSENRYG